MTVKDLERLYDYSYWANRKLLAVMTHMPPEEFTKPVAGSYGSIRDTLVHVLSAEWGWLDRCGGHPRGPKLAAANFPTVESLTATWTDVEGWMREFLSALTDEDVDRVIEFRSPTGEPAALPIGEMLQHGANHAVHHRGQVALLLRVLGYTPGNFDLLFYDAERHQTSVR